MIHDGFDTRCPRCGQNSRAETPDELTRRRISDARSEGYAAGVEDGQHAEAAYAIRDLLTRIVGYWDALDAVPEYIPVEGKAKEMDALINEARTALEKFPSQFAAAMLSPDTREDKSQ